MTLLPLMQFIFDSSWPTGTRSVIMTAMKVWGPISAGLIVAILFSVWWVALIGLVVTSFYFWVDPHFYEQIDWKEVEDLNVWEVMK